MLLAAKNSGVARAVVASSATALAPFSQNSAVCRCPNSGSGQAAHAVEAVDLIQFHQSLCAPFGPH